MQNKGFVGIIIAQNLSQLFFTKSADLLSADYGIFKKKEVTKNVLRTIAPDVHLCSTKITTVVKSKLAIIFFGKNALTSIHSWHRRST